MLRNGEAAEDVEKMLTAAWEVCNAPRQGVEDVRRSVRDTSTRLARNEPATGGRRLGELVPQDAGEDRRLPRLGTDAA